MHCLLRRAGRLALIGLGLTKIHERSSMLRVLGTLERLRHIVSFNLIGWAVLNSNIALLDVVSNKEISDIDVPGSLAHAFVAVFF